MHHLRRQPGRCATCGSTKHYTSQRERPVKPKAKNVEYEDDSAWSAEAEWEEQQALETAEYEASKGKKGKGKRSESKILNGSLKGRARRDPKPPDLLKARTPTQIDLSPSPSLKPGPGRQKDICLATKSKPRP